MLDALGADIAVIEEDRALEAGFARCCWNAFAGALGRCMSKPPGRWCAETETQVQFFDLDPMEVVWHGHYVKYLEIVRGVLLDTDRLQLGADEGIGLCLAGDRSAPALHRPGDLRPAAQAARRDRRMGEPPEDRLSDHRCRERPAPGARDDDPSCGGDRHREMCFVSPPVLFEKLGVAPS